MHACRSRELTVAPGVSFISMNVGTAPYMAPEASLVTTSGQRDSRGHGRCRAPSLDIYSAAVTFYELFEQLPFDTLRPFSFVRTPSKLARLLEQMGSHDPGRRPTALELIDAFEATRLPRLPPGGAHDHERAASAGAACVLCSLFCTGPAVSLPGGNCTGRRKGEGHLQVRHIQ